MLFVKIGVDDDDSCPTCVVQPGRDRDIFAKVTRQGDNPNCRVGLAVGKLFIDCSIAATVVDANDFVGFVRRREIFVQNLLDPHQKRINVLPLVVHGNNDGQQDAGSLGISMEIIRHVTVSSSVSLQDS